MNDVMLDLETLDTLPTAAIVSIGAVLFSPTTGVLGKEFYTKVDMRSCVAVGMTLDPGTISWWLGQDVAARAVFAGDDRKRITDALADFVAWLPDGARLWSHGASFDLPILEHAMRKVGFLPKWSFRDHRDTRTAYAMAKVDPKKFNDGTAHNALDDAKNQARAVCAAYQRLGIG